MNDKTTNQKASVSDAVQKVLSGLREAGYSDRTINYYRQNYDQLLSFMEKKGLTSFSQDVIFQYLSARYAMPVEDFYSPQPSRITGVMRSLKVLWDYTYTGVLCLCKKSSLEIFSCPPAMEPGYNAYVKKYPNAKHRNNKYVRRFIVFLDEMKVHDYSEIQPSHLKNFQVLYTDCVPQTLSTANGNVKKFLIFLKDIGIIEQDYSDCFVKTHIARNANIPAVWRSEDVEKLLSSINRSDAKGKRDYAILLLITQLGLRISDVRNLKPENIDWHNKKINLVMQKTGVRLELPLTDEIGWALIDYLKNGRPQTQARQIFVRLRAPYTGFSDNNNFMQQIRRYMSKAGIDVVENQHMGVHSLRSTFARNMLEQGTPLPVISTVLGHESIHSTSHYLKIDLDGLRNCVLDPEEVLCNE